MRLLKSIECRPCAHNSRMYTTLISALELKRLQESGARLMVFDCSFDLANTAAGEGDDVVGHRPSDNERDVFTECKYFGQLAAEGEASSRRRNSFQLAW